VVISHALLCPVKVRCRFLKTQMSTETSCQGCGPWEGGPFELFDSGCSVSHVLPVWGIMYPWCKIRELQFSCFVWRQRMILLLSRCICNCHAFVCRLWGLIHLAAVVEMLLKLIEGSTSAMGRRVPAGCIAASRHNKVTSSLWCLSPFFMSGVRRHVYIVYKLTICD
jgi:hypothetical protein